MFVSNGIEGAPAIRTSISLIKGAQGKLAYRGYSIDDLAENTCFEEVIYLLWFGELPTRKALANFSDQLKANRNPPQPVLEAIHSALAGGHPMDVLRTAVSMLASADPDVGDNGEDAELRKGARITAAMPTLAAFHSRIRRGLEPIAPNPEFGHAENFLFMLTGDRPDAVRAKAMNAAMTLMADHGLEASACAARVVAGAGSDLHSAVTSAIAALKGPPDGGAATDVMGMLLAIGEKSRAKEAVGEMLKTSGKIPAFGDRIYRGANPRAIQFKRICERLDGDAGGRGWFELTSHIEDIVNRRCGLSPNVDFYRAPAYHALGFSRDDFATVFTCSRAPGWIAHVIEQRADNRPMRPVEEYIGLLPRAFVPIDERV